jgi:hypothetical protein
VTDSTAPDTGAIRFAEKLLTILNEGRFTATYKYAVLLALMDLCLEYSGAAGGAPTSLTTEQLARKIVELYWPHATGYGRTRVVLVQNAGQQAAILNHIVRFRSDHAPDPGCSLSTARAHASWAFAALEREVEWSLVEMPLPRLQVVANELDPFIYTIGWDTGVRKREMRTASFDNTIRFVGRAGDYLVRLGGLLRPVIQREWTRLVARLNPAAVPELALERFLFGVDRIALGPIRSHLLELETATCFYCGKPLSRDCHVDHFIPWSRHPNNSVENLVLADARCNGSKRDNLAAAEHVQRWAERARTRSRDLDRIAADASWERSPHESLSVARSIYLRLPDDARLWHSARHFVPVDRPLLLSALDLSASP